MPAEADDLTGLHTFEFFGETFHLNPSSEYEWEMMEFASAATNGGDSDLLSGVAAVFTFLKAVVHPSDWERFRATARKNRAQVKEDLMTVVVGAFTQTTERPTGRPSASSGGPKNTKRKSAAGSSSKVAKVVRREEKNGRPDRALMVVLADEASSAA